MKKEYSLDFIKYVFNNLSLEERRGYLLFFENNKIFLKKDYNSIKKCYTNTIEYKFIDEEKLLYFLNISQEKIYHIYNLENQMLCSDY